MIKVSFWVPYRGMKSVAVTDTHGISATQVARMLVWMALNAFNADWPGTRASELQVASFEDRRA